MRLAVISDIHGGMVAFETVLADLDRAGEVDMLWFLGDYAAFGPRPAEVIRRVREIEQQRGEEKVKIIGGNADRYLVTGERLKTPAAEDEAALAALTEALTTRDRILNWNMAQLSWDDYEFLKKVLHRETFIDVAGYGRVIGYHAIPGDDESNALAPDTPDEEAEDALLDRAGRLGIGGHTHKQMDRSLNRWRAINVGSVGLAFDQPGKACWGLFTFEGDDVQVDLRALDYDVDAAIKDLDAAGHPAPAWVTGKLRP